MRADPVAAFAALLDMPPTVEVLAQEMRDLRSEFAALRRTLAPPLVSAADAARRCGVSLATMRRRIKAGDVAVVRLGSRVLVDIASLRPVDGADVARLASAARSPR